MQYLSFKTLKSYQTLINALFICPVLRKYYNFSMFLFFYPKLLRTHPSRLKPWIDRCTVAEPKAPLQFYYHVLMNLVVHCENIDSSTYEEFCGNSNQIHHRRKHRASVQYSDTVRNHMVRYEKATPESSTFEKEMADSNSCLACCLLSYVSIWSYMLGIRSFT